MKEGVGQRSCVRPQGREARLEESGLDESEATPEPGGEDEKIDQVVLCLSFGSESATVVGGEVEEGFGVFAGRDDDIGMDAEFDGVATGNGLALWGARAGGAPGVGAIGGDLSGSGHGLHAARLRGLDRPGAYPTNTNSSGTAATGRADSVCD